ncbi:MAG: PolC-type DNA polymerase III N-terminal domain-containing protein, partial [Staphylococcus epidermidis]|nr:PolC-type DNA polymerase III N-terminal domain-containing protein [Staphylococcus epidermidis]
MAMTNREKFKVLADQIKISNQLEQDILEQGELTRIDVSNKNRTWTFQISLPHFLSHEDYLLFTHAIEEEFKEIATVAIDFSIKDTNNQDEFALKYFGHCID